MNTIIGWFADATTTVCLWIVDKVSPYSNWIEWDLKEDIDKEDL